LKAHKERETVSKETLQARRAGLFLSKPYDFYAHAFAPSTEKRHSKETMK
jgi:hypothetical protein